LKTTKILTKEQRKKKEIKRRIKKLKNIIYDKLELRTKLKIIFFFIKGPRKNIINQNNKDRMGKNKIFQIEIEELN
jgi:hypothetical protein